MGASRSINPASGLQPDFSTPQRTHWLAQRVHTKGLGRSLPRELSLLLLLLSILGLLLCPFLYTAGAFSTLFAEHRCWTESRSVCSCAQTSISAAQAHRTPPL